MAVAEKRPGRINVLPNGDLKLLKQRKIQEERRIKIDTYKHWNILIRKALQRVSSIQAQNNLERWSSLIKKAEQAGFIRLAFPMKNVT